MHHLNIRLLFQTVFIPAAFAGMNCNSVDVYGNTWEGIAPKMVRLAAAYSELFLIGDYLKNGDLM